MTNHNERYEGIIRNFVVWAQANDDIRLAFIVGSRARTIVPADEWSDLDVVMAVNDADLYLNAVDWIGHIGKAMITFVEKTAIGGGRERRVLFEGGLDVDFAIFPVPQFQQLMTFQEAQMVTGRGVRILIDKDKLFPDSIMDSNAALIEKDPVPTNEAFDNLIQDFWYHAVWGAKKLLRGETLMAKACVDSYMKNQLLQLAKWHTKLTKGQETDTWHGGRFFENWADPRIVEQLKVSYAQYDPQDVKRALKETMDLFRWVALESANKLNYTYSAKADEYASRWIDEHL